MKLGILGAGELGRTFSDIARSMGIYDAIIFYDDFNSVTFTGERTYGDQNAMIKDFKAGKIDEVAIAIGYEHLQEKQEMFHRLESKVCFAKLIHPSAVIDETACLQDGLIIHAGCVVGPRTIIERGVFLNISGAVSHDAKLGSSTFCGPGVKVAGNVVVGSSCYLSTGVTIGTGVHVNSGWTVAAGAVLIKSVGALPVENQFLAGVPARIKLRS